MLIYWYNIFTNTEALLITDMPVPENSTENSVTHEHLFANTKVDDA